MTMHAATSSTDLPATFVDDGSDLAEDAMLLQQAVRRGMRISRLENHGSFVYLRHMRNAWQFDTGTFLDPKGWSETTAPPAFTSERLEAYGVAAASLAGDTVAG